MKALIEKDYEGLLVQFTGEGWFNATAVAERYGKRPNDWLVLVSTQEYIAAICEHHKVSRTHFIKTKRGNTNFSG
ncbi:KilA-N domain protein [Nitrosococcus halophilus Nc 4]|uniref:KilA-N domain protein n=1 Tax=Nitrosococcus halophilus (strain Nc4) TaxID=472759 RepID=D5BYE3_NITHN|nr:KilA-N domain-containing protein [Nitrosococcus halophilus]ADE14126.1 KilA-N domain protein [Nitrosococcus halophilus Nc 4]